jgi:ferredoxin--NADP+ reductase
MASWNNGRVVKQKQWSNTLHTLYVESALEPYKAGQFVKIGLEIDQKVEGRPYSLVNPPGKSLQEFYYINVPNGVLTAHLVKLKANDTILVAPRAHGFLVLDEIPVSKHLWMMATGTGVGPFLSMLDTDAPWQRYERVILVYAVRTKAELSYQDKILKFLANHPKQFIFIPFLSQEISNATMDGRIPQAIQDGRLEERAGITITADDSQIMLCGNPQMVKDTSNTLIDRGLTKNRRTKAGQITMENYW